jgi:uncharacterized protein YecE (DUF72 family)
MSWSYPGWKGVVYAAHARTKDLSGLGLTAYARHPLLRTVEIDRTYYEPIGAEVFRGYAAQVPEDFRFVVKAHEDCTVKQFPGHARYGKKRGKPNPRFLDPAHAAEQVVAPAVAGLGDKLGAVLFQFPPQDVGRPEAFAARLRAFLGALPPGPTYGVELRNRDLLTPAYGAALIEGGAVHVHNVWGGMPLLLDQARRLPPATRRPLMVRWLFPKGDSYEQAGERYLPFDKLVDQDHASRAAVAALVTRALGHGVPALVTVDNKAEGCAPESIVRLSRELAARQPPPST